MFLRKWIFDTSCEHEFKDTSINMNFAHEFNWSKEAKDNAWHIGKPRSYVTDYIKDFNVTNIYMAKTFPQLIIIQSR